MKRKLTIINKNGKKEILEFKMTNKTVFDIDEKFNNYGEVLNGLMYGQNLYTNAIRVLSSSCITREISPEELVDILTPEQITSEVVSLASSIYFDYRGIKQEPETGEINSEEINSKKK